MAAALSGYSRVIFWLKIALPIVALIILSTLFLFARRIDFEGALPYAEVDINALANDPRLTAPAYSTVTEDGTAIRVVADSARPGPTPEDPATAENVLAVYDLEDGGKVTVSARTATMDQIAQRLHLEGEVTVLTDNGYDLRARTMEGPLDRTDIVAEGDVRGKAPLGTISSEKVRISGPAGEQLLVFKGAVRLIYRPEN
ncbi:hypothetical protein [Frigidibacter sp. SD6-1]|uniref:hypothetical protein n=1 Tax=Frigidibacter sp. SD6-1 TaxID=3032581 RepID=UPI0024DFF5CF|nr:hypothetical protein [Frigidibacter sp. SD6-1]